MTKQNNFTECKCQWSINSSYFYSSGEILPLHSGFISVLCPSKHLITPAPLNTGNMANRKNQKDKTVEYNYSSILCLPLHWGIFPIHRPSEHFRSWSPSSPKPGLHVYLTVLSCLKSSPDMLPLPGIPGYTQGAKIQKWFFIFLNTSFYLIFFFKKRLIRDTRIMWA